MTAGAVAGGGVDGEVGVWVGAAWLGKVWLGGGVAGGGSFRGAGLGVKFELIETNPLK